jgi:hypothetical protein
MPENFAEYAFRPEIRGVLDLIPDHPACRHALFLAQQELTLPQLYAGFRLFLYASAFLRKETPAPEIVNCPRYPEIISLYQSDTYRSPAWVPPVEVPAYGLFVACILLPYGTAPRFHVATVAAEIISADEVMFVLTTNGMDRMVARDFWLAVAFHTSTGKAETMAGPVRAVKLALQIEQGLRPPPDPDALPGGKATAARMPKELPMIQHCEHGTLVQNLKAPRSSILFASWKAMRELNRGGQT